MKIYIGGFRGQSLISKGIKAWTWGDKSHVAPIRADGRIIEAWHQDPTGRNWRQRWRGRVTESPSPWTLHKPGTEVEVYKLLYPEPLHSLVWENARLKVGQAYDFRALVGFLPLLRWAWRDDPKKWFCSHETVADCRLGDGRHQLFNDSVPLYKIDPTFCCASPWLDPLGVARDLAEFFKLIGTPNTRP